MTKIWEKLITPSPLNKCPSSSKFEANVPDTNSRIYSIDYMQDYVHLTI